MVVDCFVVRFDQLVVDLLEVVVVVLVVKVILGVWVQGVKLVVGDWFDGVYLQVVGQEIEVVFVVFVNVVLEIDLVVVDVVECFYESFWDVFI